VKNLFVVIDPSFVRMTFKPIKKSITAPYKSAIIDYIIPKAENCYWD